MNKKTDLESTNDQDDTNGFLHPELNDQKYPDDDADGDSDVDVKFKDNLNADTNNNPNFRYSKPKQISVGQDEPMRINQHEEIVPDPFYADSDSNFFSYFMFLMLACVIAYVAYHNKQKILALILEGRRTRTSGRGGRRKQHTAAYQKLDSNLEEAIQSSGHVHSNQVIY